MTQYKEYELAIEQASKAMAEIETHVDKRSREIVRSMIESEDFTTLSYINKRKGLNETSCLICATDFSLLLMHNDPSIFTTIGHSCMRCAAYCCYKCVYQMTRENPHCGDSIGYQCGACKFHNYGKTAAVPVLRWETTPDFHLYVPPSTGFSTMDQMKGEALPTSGASSQKLAHTENIYQQREFIRLNAEQQDAEFSLNDD